MSRDRLRDAALGLLAVVAVALTARTLPTARQREPGGDGAGGAGIGEGGGIPARSTEPLPQLLDVPLLAELIALLAVLFALVALWGLYRHWRSLFRVAVPVLVLSLVLAVLLQGVPFDPLPKPSSSGVPGTDNVSVGAGGGGSTETEPSVLSIALVAVIAVAVVGIAVAANRRPADRDDRTDPDDDETRAAVAVGRAAGRAADRIEETTAVDNEVYRAFREMTARLDVADPETTTAREFERVAVESGLSADDVAALTDLFERARYDDGEIDGDDERRAVELLRRIESRYAEGEP
ncbi:DUF4129 domain-containing protein [Halomicrobium katesii]|uniref:DUF4129 domain-containing protein n=1 Tax=Halomicrobium katesii TaxID=437163 RepID=UPI00037B3A5F|nr:DUF4129 domain-containing protein [Halomicrobium katesii]